MEAISTRFYHFPPFYTNALQPRYLITSLALNDLAIGLLITPFGTLPALLHCWPYGEIFCQIQVSCCTINLCLKPYADADLNILTKLMIITLATIFSHMIFYHFTGTIAWSFNATKCCHTCLYGCGSLYVRIVSS